MRRSKITFEVPFSESKAKYIRSLTDHVLQKFLGDVAAKVTVNYIFSRNLLRDAGVMAYSDEDIEKNSYTILVDASINLRDLLLSVAHELVHVKQFVLKEHMLHSISLSFDDYYFDDPAEIEAYGRELGLFTIWCRKHGYHKRFSWAAINRGTV